MTPRWSGYCSNLGDHDWTGDAMDLTPLQPGAARATIGTARRRDDGDGGFRGVMELMAHFAPAEPARAEDTRRSNALPEEPVEPSRSAEESRPTDEDETEASNQEAEASDSGRSRRHRGQGPDDLASLPFVPTPVAAPVVAPPPPGRRCGDAHHSPAGYSRPPPTRTFRRCRPLPPRRHRPAHRSLQGAGPTPPSPPQRPPRPRSARRPPGRTQRRRHRTIRGQTPTSIDLSRIRPRQRAFRARRP